MGRLEKHEDTFINGRGLNEAANLLDLNLLKRKLELIHSEPLIILIQKKMMRFS